MGNSLSTNACLDVEDLKESTEVALAVAQSLEPVQTPTPRSRCFIPTPMLAVRPGKLSETGCVFVSLL